MTESYIQIEICNLLSSISSRNGMVWFSVPNEGFLTAAMEGKIEENKLFSILTKLKKMGMTDGVSDLIILFRGGSFCLEAKGAKGRQSKKQKIFEAKCAKNKIPYKIVRSCEEAQTALNEWGIK